LEVILVISARFEENGSKAFSASVPVLNKIFFNISKSEAVVNVSIPNSFSALFKLSKSVIVPSSKP